MTLLETILKAQPGSVVPLDPKEFQAYKDLQVLLERKGLKAPRESKDLLALLDPPDLG